MSAGYPVTKQDLDNRIGSMIVNVRGALAACVQFKAGFLDDATLGSDGVLTSLGYNPTEIATIRAAFTAMQKLSDIAKATATQATASDFYFDAKKLIGLNV